MVFQVADLQLFFLEGDPVIAFLENQAPRASKEKLSLDELGEAGVSAGPFDLDLLDRADAFEGDFQALKARVCSAASDRLGRPITSVALSGDGEDWCEALATHLGLDKAHSATLFDELKSDIGAKFPHALAAFESALQCARGEGPKIKTEIAGGY